MENDCSLGRKVKISNVMLQRKFLEEKITEAIEEAHSDGSSDLRYFGHIYPENITWLIDNEFEVHKIRATSSDSPAFGLETYVITPQTSISLHEDELVESEAIAEDFKAKERMKASFVDFIENIMNENANNSDCEDGDSSFDDGDYDDECEYDEREPEDECFFTPGGDLS